MFFNEADVLFVHSIAPGTRAFLHYNINININSREAPAFRTRNITQGNRQLSTVNCQLSVSSCGGNNIHFKMQHFFEKELGLTNLQKTCPTIQVYDTNSRPNKFNMVLKTKRIGLTSGLKSTRSIGFLGRQLEGELSFCCYSLTYLSCSKDRLIPKIDSVQALLLVKPGE